nr:uncharacterized protein I303_03209 [Kwoniella dejecticola CBS 10117]OBR87185.1 hypothetical protein I303_03209 [Kwoniella dejecticola CBS 10117]
MFGGINVHFPMVFDDGIKWLIRIRQADNGIPPLAILDTTARSEVCTLQVVKSFGLPVPGAWMPEHHLFRDEANNHGSSDHLSICYFFCEYMEGASLSMPNLMPKNCWDANEQDRKIIEDYAKHQIEMSNHPLLFTEIGCLFPSASAEPDMKTQVGPLASLWGLNYVDPPRYPGPFKPNKERYLAQIDIALSNLTRETDQNHCLNAYLWHLTLRELVETCAELSEEVSEVYVRHADDKGDILKGTEEGRITAIFDWEMAYVTTKAEAFSSPIFCYLTYVNYEDQEVYTVREHMLIEYYKKSSRPDLAECVRRGKKYQMLSTIGRFQGWYKMLCYPWALMDAFEETKPDSLRPPLYTSKAWTIYMVDRYKNDQGLQGILKELKWDLDMQKQLSHKEWEEEDAKRRHWWAMSALERTQKKRETIAAKLTRMRAKDFRE